MDGDDGFVAIFWLLVAAGIFVWWGWNDDGWIGRARYAWSYKVPLDQVQFSPKPYDCDWGTAPIGAKHCSYAPAVSAYNADGNVVGQDGYTIISKDGKPVVVTSVKVGWTMVAD